jgi:hypothetical protein
MEFTRHCRRGASRDPANHQFWPEWLAWTDPRFRGDDVLGEKKCAQKKSGAAS